MVNRLNKYIVLYYDVYVFDSNLFLKLKKNLRNDLNPTSYLHE